MLKRRGNFDEKQDIFMGLPTDGLLVTREGRKRNYSGEIRHPAQVIETNTTCKGQMGHRAPPDVIHCEGNNTSYAAINSLINPI